MNDEMSFLGLGFATGPAPSNAASAAESADSLMRHYLQQCVEYHETRQHLEQQQQQTEAPQFVSAVEQVPVTPQDMLVSPAEPVFVAPPPVSTAAQEAMAKARAIVEKFQVHHHQQQQQQLEIPAVTGMDSCSPEEYRQRRERHFEKHRERLRKATLKNFEYVAKREEQRLQLQLQQINQTRQMEASLQQRHGVIMQRRQQVFSSTAGIGTSKRQTLEKQKQKKGHSVQVNESVALYITGLPVDGSFTESALQNLFASYGTIRKVHLYRNKTTGQVKGDALVVFQMTSINTAQRQDFLDTVCSQMTGAQLPCGSVLQVEPADPEYKKKSKSQEKKVEVDQGGSNFYGPSNGNGAKDDVKARADAAAVSQDVTHDQDEEKRAQEATEDLDDFFASLT